MTLRKIGFVRSAAVAQWKKTPLIIPKVQGLSLAAGKENDKQIVQIMFRQVSYSLCKKVIFQCHKTLKNDTQENRLCEVSCSSTVEGNSPHHTKVEGSSPAAEGENDNQIVQMMFRYVSYSQCKKVILQCHKTLKNDTQENRLCEVSSCSTVVEHSPHHIKEEGLSPAAGGENDIQVVQIMFKQVSYSQCTKVVLQCHKILRNDAQRIVCLRSAAVAQRTLTSSSQGQGFESSQWRRK